MEEKEKIKTNIRFYFFWSLLSGLYAIREYANDSSIWLVIAFSIVCAIWIISFLTELDKL